MEKTKSTKGYSHPKLNQWLATAICGNDILSSALYVSGFAIAFAGIYAPLVLFFVVIVLFFYKSVYTEVVEALPVNGGAYNCLLNATSKTFAAGAGVMTLLSYIATAVLSAKVGVEYFAQVNFIEPFFTFLGKVFVGINPVIVVTIALLLTFALLVISGLKDSAKVALTIFVLHTFCLVTFLVLGAFYYFSGGQSYFMENLQHTTAILIPSKGLFMTLYLAFSASLLGISGFESSANFVEEQQPGVFRKTLRNMLIGVAIFNPLIALVVLNSMSYGSVITAKDFLLADAAQVIGGSLFKTIIGLDALLVLSGAVLTAFVGVSGLVYRMAADACLPNVLTAVNKKGSYPRIVISFFILCSSILIITRGELASLAGVYTISFLVVMSSFAFGNILLKQARTELKRTYTAPLLFVMIAFFGTFLGMLGNIRIDENNLHFFEIYFIPAVIIVFIVIYQDYILRFAMKATRRFPRMHMFLFKQFDNLIQGNFVVFIHNIDRLHKILEYINRNETGWNITLVHCRSGSSKESEERFKKLEQLLPELKEAGVFPHLNIRLIYKDKPFGPKVIEEVSRELAIEKNRILIGSIHHTHPFDYADLGGVRIIF